MGGPTPAVWPPRAARIEPQEMDPLLEGCGMADSAACCMACFCPCNATGEIAEAIGQNYALACFSYASYYALDILFPVQVCGCRLSWLSCCHGCYLAHEFRQY